MPPRKDHKYEVNDKVLCKHGLYFYEAKIIEVEEVDGEMVYMVHYQGWHKRYDERIRQSQCADYFLPLTEANIAKAKADIQEATSAKSKRKRTKLEDDDARKSETGSRASTPSDRAGSSSHAPSTHSERRGHSAKTENDTRKGGADAGANRVSADLFAPEVDSQLEQLANLPRLIKNILVNEHDAVVNQGKLAILPAKITVHDIVEKYVEFTESRYGNKAVEIEHDSGITYLADDDLLIRTARAMRDYFDILLPYQLLYKFERLQFNTLAKKEQEKFEGVQARSEDAMPRRSRKSSREVKTSFPLSVYVQILDGGPLRPDIIRPSRFYGLAHLLRMLVKLPALLRAIPCDQADLVERIACIHDFIAFLRQNAPFILDLNKDYKEATAEYGRSVGMS
ncbi:unnamed protein product [Cylicocyclus nassatus]|uniref:MRG domain-containing protein n=1 Tax=Cylicocyclus nassatus TaxID=53992 RepID=A0AA36M662_CYLNA|nr:unnamed protein product [Cylicocyclus nassatus]